VGLRLPLSLSLAPGGFPDDADDVSEADSGRRLAEAVFLLPPPYREAMALQKIEGLSRAAVLSLLQDWRHVSHERARHILSEGHKMLWFAWMGGYPRHLWPRRYPPFLHIPAFCPTLPPGDLRHLCTGEFPLSPVGGAAPWRG
jgi:hypothetical protein